MTMPHSNDLAGAIRGVNNDNRGGWAGTLLRSEGEGRGVRACPKKGCFKPDGHAPKTHGLQADVLRQGDGRRRERRAGRRFAGVSGVNSRYVRRSPKAARPQ